MASTLPLYIGTHLVPTPPCYHPGRLKLRVVNGAGQLIAYVRPDTEGPKTSEYNVTSVPDPESLKLTLSMTLGTKGCVVKERWLYMIGQTRVHCDTVKGE